MVTSQWPQTLDTTGYTVLPRRPVWATPRYWPRAMKARVPRSRSRTMRNVTSVAPGPVSLAAWCRRSIRSSVGKEGLDRGDINSLALPTAIKEYIMYR